MSQQVDRKVVDMEFNNQNFEKNVSTTLNSLAALKKSLSFKGVEKSFSEVERASNGVKLDGIRDSVLTVSSKFSAFEVIAITALSNITNSAINAGKQLVSSLSIDQISAGWSKYAEKTSAVQTIMAATRKQFNEWSDFKSEYENLINEASNVISYSINGTEIHATAEQYDFLVEKAKELAGLKGDLKDFKVGSDDYNDYLTKLNSSLGEVIHNMDFFSGEQMDSVNGQLEKLNWFTDETSYSFLDMVNNIGKFTSNNVKLDTAVTAMQGISTWAAISGANVTEAGRAMYNLSQAMAVGAVKLQDWKSIENANMSTTEFKQTVIDTALSLGTLKKTEDGVIKTLKDNEVTISNFNQTLSDSWFTSDVLLKSLDAYGGFATKLYDISEETGLTATKLLQYIEDFSKGSLDISKIVEETGVTAERLNDIFTELSDSTYDLGRRAFRAAQEAKTFQEAIDATKDAVSTGWMNTFEIIFGDYEKAKVLWTDVANNLWDIFAGGAEQRNNLLRAALYKDEWDEFAKTIEKTSLTVEDLTFKEQRLMERNGLAIDQFAALRDRANETGEPLEALIHDFKKLSGRDLLIQSLKNAFDALFSAIEIVKEAWHNIFPETSADKLYSLIERLKDFTERLLLSEERIEKIKKTLTGFFALLDVGKYYISTVIKFITNLLKYIFKLDEGLNVGNKFADWALNLRKTIIENDKFGKTLDKVSGFLKKIIDYIKETIRGNTLLGKGIRSVIKIIRTFIDYIRETIKGNTQLGITIKGIIKTITSVIKNFSEFASKVQEKVNIPKFSILGILEGVFSFINSLGSRVLALVQKVWPIIKKIATGIGSFIKNIAVQFKDLLKKSGINDIFDFLKAGILSGALAKILQSIMTYTGKITIFDNVIQNIKEAIAAVTDTLSALQTKLKSDALKSIAISLAILSVSLLLLSTIDAGSLMAAASAMGVLLTEMVIALKAISSMNNGLEPRKIKKLGSALIKMAAAVLILAIAMKMLANLSWEGIAKGAVAIAAIITVLVIFARVLSSKAFKGNSLKKISKGLITIALAMVIFAVAMKLFASLDWGGIAKGLVSITALMAVMTISLKMIGKGSTSAAISIAIISASMLTMFLAFKLFSTLKWESIAKGLVSVAGLMLIIVVSLKALTSKSLSGNLLAASVAILIVSDALIILSGVLLIIGNIGTGKLAKGLATIAILLMELAIALKVMKGTLGASASLLVTAISLGALYLVLKAYGNLEWSSIIKGFVALAGILAIVGLAAKFLSPLAGAMIKLAVGLAAVGLGLLIIGAGLSLIGIGIQLLIEGISKGAKALVEALLTIIEGIVAFIPKIATTLAKLVGTFLVELGKLLGQNLPFFVAMIFNLLVEVLKTLAEKAPEIVGYLMDFIINVIDALALKIPDLIKSLVGLMMAVFKGFAEALEQLDPDILAKGLKAAGIIAALLVVLATLGALGAAAIAGVIVFGIVVAELSLVLAALGKLYKSDGLTSLIKDSGNVLEAIGYAIGRFVGALVGGFTEAAAESLPSIADSLSNFMERLQPFLDGLSAMDVGLMAKIAILPAILLAIVAADVIQGIGRWLTGGSDIEKFTSDLLILGYSLVKFSGIVKDIDSDAVTASANAALALTEFARNIPNEGGLIAKIVGDNSLKDFAEMLPDFGKAIQKYYQEVKDITPETVTASANAAMTIAEFAKNIPNQGGWLATVVGDNTLGDFAAMLPDFGKGMAEYSKEIKDVDPNVVVATTNSAKSIVELANNLPNAGGWISALVGDNTLGDFAKGLKPFGEGMRIYANEIKGVNPKVISATSAAAESISELANNLPNEGGWVDAILGDNSLGTFAKGLKPFGQGMKEYANEISGLDPDAVSASASVASLMVDLSKNIPKMGGLDDLINGKTDLSSFGKTLKGFGEGLVAYSLSVSGIDLDIESVDASLIMAEKLVGLSSSLEPIGGVVDFFDGKKDLATFGSSLESFGYSLVAYSKAVSSNEDGFNVDAVNTSIAVAESLVALAANLEPMGGVVDFFQGYSDLGTFGKTLPKFGNGLSAYCDVINDTTFDAEKVKSAMEVAEALITLSSNIEPMRGIVNFFQGYSDLGKFGKTLPEFANGISAYCSSINDTNFDNEKVTASVDAANKLIEMSHNIDKIGGLGSLFSGKSDLGTFGDTLKEFGSSLAEYAKSISNINVFDLESSVESAQKLLDFMKGTSGLDKKCTNNFTDGLKNLGKDSKDKFIKAFKDAHSEIQEEAEKFLQKFLDKADGKKNEFYKSGKNSIKGFCDGIEMNLNIAEKAGEKMALAALNAAKKALNEHSPSKAFEKIGAFCPPGLYNGVIKNVKYSRMAGTEIGNAVLDKTKEILSKISSEVDSDVDIDPVIRPVLDLEDIKNGSKKINTLLSSRKAFGISAKFNSLSGTEIGDTASEGPITYSFVQNNYSPKSLSRTDIYRQTNNQFSAFQRRMRSYDSRYKNS